MGYQEDYHRAAKELELAIEERDKAEDRVLSLQKRMTALIELIALDNPEAAHAINRQKNAAQVLMASVAPRISNLIRRILAGSKEALTVRELRENLRQAGWTFTEQSNPAATIGAVCARLVEQKFAEQHFKGGRKAWKIKI